jgi:hypothetical protein
MHIGKLRRDVKFGFVRYDVGTARNGVDGDLVTALDGQDRF